MTRRANNPPQIHTNNMPTRRQTLLTALSLSFAACSNGRRKRRNGLPADTVVLALGDSLTYGFGANPAESYPSQLAAASGWRVINAGKNGDTSGGALTRLPQLLREHNPRLVIISIGGNDFLQHLPEQETRANITALITTCRDAGTDIILVGEPELSLGAALGYPGDHALYGDIATAENVPYYKGGWSAVLGKSNLKSDQIHPNAAGYAVFTTNFTAGLKKEGWLR